jgi:hypothetical protein
MRERDMDEAYYGGLVLPYLRLCRGREFENPVLAS